MKINFTKMQGLGNDFVVLDFDEYQKTGKNPCELAKLLCKRNFSIGADGLIIVNPYTDKADISWIFYNSDGTVAQMCGNGMRCFAKYVIDKKIINKKSFSVETLAGIITPEILDNGEIRVNMNKPYLKSESIPFSGSKNLNYELDIDGKIFDINAIGMGNPHCVIFTDDDTLDLAKKYGSKIEVSTVFPEKTNVEFVKIVSKNEAIMSVWERGCGITLACGTGACATTVAGILRGYFDKKVKVNLLGGSLEIEWQGVDHPVYMTGKAEYSFIGEVEIV